MSDGRWNLANISRETLYIKTPEFVMIRVPFMDVVRGNSRRILGVGSDIAKHPRVVTRQTPDSH